jgi:hypothetical protein
MLLPRDVALCGGLCALASSDREGLHELLFQNVHFKHFLESFPMVREMMLDFHASRYASCLNYLERLRVCGRIVCVFVYVCMCVCVCIECESVCMRVRIVLVSEYVHVYVFCVQMLTHFMCSYSIRGILYA